MSPARRWGRSVAGLFWLAAAIALPAAVLAHVIVQEDGISLEYRNQLDFLGAGIVCVDDPTSLETDCTVDDTATDLACGTACVSATEIAAMSSADLRGILSDEAGTGAAMFGVTTSMADDIACTGSQSVRRNTGDTAWECFTPSGGGGATYVDNETPAGVIDGSNATFTLGSSPSPAASLELQLNGALQVSGTNYTLSGVTITYTSGFIPQTSDYHRAWYRTAGSTGFGDGETPTGVIDGVNAAFTLANTPAPTGSLELYLNGQLQVVGTNYTLSAATVTYSSGFIPQTSDYHRVWYRF